MKFRNFYFLFALAFFTSSFACFASHPPEQLLPPVLESVQDGGYATGNNCYLVVSFRSQGTNEVEYDIERKAAGSSHWEKIATIARGETQVRIEINGDKRGWIRMISLAGDGSVSDYTPDERSFCQ